VVVFHAAVARRFGLQDNIVTAQLYLGQIAVTRVESPDIQHTFAVALMLLDRSGLGAEARSLILVHLVQLSGIHLGAIALFDGRFATLAPPSTAPVHLDIVELKEIGDPVKAGRRPLISTILHLNEVYRICREVIHGNGNVP